VVADALEAIAEHRGARTAQACRSVLKTAFSAAKAKGLMDSNPALVTDAVKVRVQRTRFTWETFLQVWRALESEPAWLRNATALALISGQRREDIVSAAFGDVSDDVWRLTQAKTGRKLAIPLDLRLDVLGMSLRDVVAACRRTAVAWYALSVFLARSSAVARPSTHWVSHWARVSPSPALSRVQ
jgi:integrase